MPAFEAPADRLRMTEKQWQALVVEAATLLGWLPVHFRQMVGNPAGWPDLLLFRDGRVLVAELKTEAGKLGPRQAEWIDRFAAVGVEVRVWRPSDWPAVEAALKGEAQ